VLPITKQSSPEKIPTTYPPINGLGFYEYALGIVKTIKADAPRDAIIAVSSNTSRNNKINKIVNEASPH